MRVLLTLILTLMTATAGAFEGTFENTSALNGRITDVKIYLFDMARTDGCNDSECYRIDVYVNGNWFARWPASPGKKHWGTKFVGVYTPEYNRSIHPSHIHDRYWNKFGEAMPYAMFLKTGSGAKSGIALHAGHVTGRKESHGCIRLRHDDAKFLNTMVREAFANGGKAHVWTRHTRP